MFKKLVLWIQNLLYSTWHDALLDVSKQQQNEAQKSQKIKREPISNVSKDKDDTDLLKGLPAIEPLSKYKEDQPPLADELIEGILRCGHKMLISGPSKAGKSFLLMQLAVAIAEGSEWLKFHCKKGRVLYVNLEIDGASFINRFVEIYDRLGIPKDHMQDILMWNLRGHSIPFDRLLPELIDRIKGENIDAVIVDPIYKVITGDENSASEMGKFCNLFDRICNEVNCSCIYAHHHSKSAASQRNAMYRSSGSGVFSRDPDAILDISELKPQQLKATFDDGSEVKLGPELPAGATCWQMETTLREFKDVEPFGFYFEYPLHVVDTDGTLSSFISSGSTGTARSFNSKCTSKASRKARLDKAYEHCLETMTHPTIEAMAHYCNVCEKTIRNWIAEFDEDYSENKGTVEKRLN